MVINMNRLNKKGFTLIELLAVIVVTSLVLGLSAYGIINAYKKSKEKSLVLNETSIFEAARIYSTEASSNVWKSLNDKEYFCTTIQRLKNAGLLKKEAKSEEYSDATLITVQRDATTFNVENVSFLGEESTDIRNLCDIKFFTIHYEYNAGNETGNVPNDQIAEICTSENCIDTHISSFIPKRDGYRFVGWNTESDYSGTKYEAGQVLQYYTENTTIVLYAQWEEDSYVIKYNSNGSNVTGNMDDTSCLRNKNCKLLKNDFSRNGYVFNGWNTKSDGTGTKYDDEQIVNNITSNSEITLYAMWKAKYKAIIKYNVGENGQIKDSTTSASGVNYSWTTDATGIISRSKNGGNYTDSFFNIPYNDSADLKDYNNIEYMYITNTNSGYAVPAGNVWKCISGECNGTVYNQVDEYNSNDFCNALNNDCTVVLSVNWENKNLLSPIITPSDGIPQTKWHNADYSLSITSENTNNPSYEYKIDNGNYQGYSSPISVTEEGIATYTARTKIDSKYSSETVYTSKLDKTPPSAPIIDNPSDEEWVNYSFSLTLHSTDNLSGIKKYQYKYADTNWKTYANSDSENFVTTPFSADRNELVYVRACDYAENCSEESSTFIRIDTHKPTVEFVLKDGNNVVNASSNNYSLSSSTVPNWIKYTPTLVWNTSDAMSGINISLADNLEFNKANNATLVTSGMKPSTITGNSSGVFSTSIGSDGYRYFNFKACDMAGNCTYSKVYLRIDKVDPTVSFTMKNGNNVVNISSNDYSLSSSTVPNWIKYAPNLVWNASDAMSGVNISLADNLEYNKANNATLVTSGMKSLTVNGNSSGVFSASIGSDGYRYIKLKVCDKANNCIYSDVYFRLDTKSPTVSFQMLNGSTVVASTNYSSSPSNSLKWFTFKPTLRWIATDSLSGINTAGRYYFNNHSSETLNESFPTTGGYSLTGTLNSGNTYYFDNSVDYGGYRKYRAKICDNAENCTEDNEYFKYYANTPVGMYVNAKSGLNCRLSPSSSGISKTLFSCGTYLSNIVKSYTGNWYYSSSYGCYVDGSYLSSSKPNCSSGGGGGSNPNCTECISKADCDNVSGAIKACINGYCMYDYGGGTESFGCE